jgi:dTDP-4-dehydrorhamnose 3,5-epimerase
VNCQIKDVLIRELNRHVDQRGWLTELFRQDEISAEFYPVMAYVSMTKPGIARGPHEHVDQADLFCFIGPSTFRLYLWDNRAGSSTYGCRCVMDVGEDSPTVVMVPPGVVHAYKNIGREEGIVYNAPNRLYAGKGRRSEVDQVRHEDTPDSPFALDI